MPRTISRRPDQTPPQTQPRPAPPPRVSLVPSGETKHDRFIRLINHRSKPVIKYLRMIGRLGTPDYERTSAEIDAIEAAIKIELEKAIAALRRGHETAEIKDIL